MKWYDPRRLSTFQLYIVFVILLLIVVSCLPPTPATLTRYHLSSGAYRILLLATTAVPAALTWAAIFYGYEYLRRYRDTVRHTSEGPAFDYLTRGSRWVAFYLPIITLISLFLGGIANAHPGFRNASLTLTTYVAIIMATVAYLHISTGARILANDAHVRPTLIKTRLLTLAFIVMGVFYCYFIVRHTLGPDGNKFYLPLFWMLLTVVVPYFFAWLMGLLAVLDLDAYATHVPGVLYRRALRQLSGGLLLIIASSILLQYVNSASTERGRLVLGAILLVRYILYIVIAGGFALVGTSAKKLQQIEKI